MDEPRAEFYGYRVVNGDERDQYILELTQKGCNVIGNRHLPATGEQQEMWLVWGVMEVVP